MPPSIPCEYLRVADYVVLFNYRGLANSTGRTTCSNLVIDATSVLQFVHKQLGVPRARTVLVGQSLGGGVAAQAALHYPGVHVCNQRSFASLPAVAPYHVLPQGMWTTAVGPRPAKGVWWYHLCRAIQGGVQVVVRYGCEWVLDSAAAWPRLKSGTKWIL